MTKNQVQAFKQLWNDIDPTKADGITWHVTPNYYTKLYELTAITPQGGFHFGMHKHYSGEVSIYLSHNISTHESNSMIVSSGFGTDLIRETLPRLNFKRYIEFVREHMEVPSQTIAVV